MLRLRTQRYGWAEVQKSWLDSQHKAKECYEMSSWRGIGPHQPSPSHLDEQLRCYCCKAAANTSDHLNTQPILPQDPSKLLWRWVGGELLHSWHIQGYQEVSPACCDASIFGVKVGLQPRLNLDWNSDCLFRTDILLQPPAATSSSSKMSKAHSSNFRIKAVMKASRQHALGCFQYYKMAARHSLLPHSQRVLCMVDGAKIQEALMPLKCPVTGDGYKVDITLYPSQPLCCWPRLPAMCTLSALQAAPGDPLFGHSRGCSGPGTGPEQCAAAAQGPCLWRQRRHPD